MLNFTDISVVIPKEASTNHQSIFSNWHNWEQFKQTLESKHDLSSSTAQPLHPGNLSVCFLKWDEFEQVFEMWKKTNECKFTIIKTKIDNNFYPHVSNPLKLERREVLRTESSLKLWFRDEIYPFYFSSPLSKLGTTVLVISFKKYF